MEINIPNLHIDENVFVKSQFDALNECQIINPFFSLKTVQRYKKGKEWQEIPGRVLNLERKEEMKNHLGAVVEDGVHFFLTPIAFLKKVSKWGEKERRVLDLYAFGFDYKYPFRWFQSVSNSIVIQRHIARRCLSLAFYKTFTVVLNKKVTDQGGEYYLLSVLGIADTPVSLWQPAEVCRQKLIDFRASFDRDQGEQDKSESESESDSEGISKSDFDEAPF